MKLKKKINQKKLKKTNSNKKNKNEIFIFYFLKTKLMSNDEIRKKISQKQNISSR